MTSFIKQFRTKQVSREPITAMERIKDGYLLFYSSGQKNPQKKWITFDKQPSELKYMISIYPNNKEKRFQKKSFSLDDDNFSGIEEGNVGHDGQRYFTIFAAKNVIIFQTDDREDAAGWTEKFKEHLTCERWTVRLQDEDESSSKMVPYLLHVTASAVSLTKFNPSKLFKRWSIKYINCVNSERGFLCIGVTGAGVDSGYYQIKAQNASHLMQIKEAISMRINDVPKNSLQNTGEPEKMDSEADTDLLSPHLKLLTSRIGFPDVVEDDQQKADEPVVGKSPTVPVHFPDVIKDIDSKNNAGQTGNGRFHSEDFRVFANRSGHHGSSQDKSGHHGSSHHVSSFDESGHRWSSHDELSHESGHHVLSHDKSGHHGLSHDKSGHHGSSHHVPSHDESGHHGSSHNESDHKADHHGSSYEDSGHHGSSYDESGHHGSGCDSSSQKELNEDNGATAVTQREYQNLLDRPIKMPETVKKPPPLPCKDCNRHFKSETVGETIAAIQQQKFCYRDSLNLSPSKRADLFAKMDASGWWKDLAGAIGLNASDIQVIENLTPSLHKFWTEVVIYHWECTRTPKRVCNIRELQNIAQETNRQDLYNMLATAKVNGVLD